MPNIKTLLTAAVFFLGVPDGSPGAAEIFRWVDAEGVVHFSDTAPAAETDTLSTISIEANNAPDYVPGDNEYAILRQAERMRARYEEIKARQDARRRASRDESVARSDGPESRTRYDVGYRQPYFYLPRERRRAVNVDRPALRQKQLATLDRLGLDHARRPHSINSSAHHRRVAAGAALLEPPATTGPH